MNEKDKLYEKSPLTVADFVFDEPAVGVFPDMIKRSVPGYGLVLQIIGLIAGRHVQQGSCVYDLGCSLGAATQTPAQRLGLLERIVAGTRYGGVLVLSEKMRFAEPEQQDIQTSLHHDFKRAQNYSSLEIAGKRSALECVLRPDTEAEHRERPQAAGWRQTVRCFQAFNFVSYLACRNTGSGG